MVAGAVPFGSFSERSWASHNARVPQRGRRRPQSPPALASCSVSRGQLTPTLHERVVMGIRPLVDEADTVTQSQAAPVPPVDARECPPMTSEISHLSKDRQEHECAEREARAVVEPYTRAASLKRNGDHLGVADVGDEGGFDVVCADTEDRCGWVLGDEHPAVKARR